MIEFVWYKLGGSSQFLSFLKSTLTKRRELAVSSHMTTSNDMSVTPTSWPLSHSRAHSLELSGNSSRNKTIYELCSYSRM